MSFIYDLVGELDRIRSQHGINIKEVYSEQDNPCYKAICFISSKIKVAIRKNKNFSKTEINRELYLEIAEIIHNIKNKRPENFTEGYFLQTIEAVLEKWHGNIFVEAVIVPVKVKQNVVVDAKTTKVDNNSQKIKKAFFLKKSKLLRMVSAHKKAEQALTHEELAVG